MQATRYELIGEQLYTETLPNGLRVALLPKAGYSKTYAVFTTRYGSVDNDFQVDSGTRHQVVDGIAHFLEHKLFEEEWGDVFHDFATQGASANAFTSHDRTAYLFSATSGIEKNLGTLLDFVQRPYLTPESIEKEKGIIEQEIRMYDDMPFWRGYRHLLECLFVASPVRIDIAGTVESIRRIDQAALMACYETFYHPSNMMLAVVGDFEPESIMTLIQNNQAAKTFAPPRSIQRFTAAEPGTIQQARHEIQMAVSRPLVLLGWKDATVLEESDHLQRELCMAIVQDVLFGAVSPLAQGLLDQGLIDDAPSCDYEIGSGYGFSYIGTETDDPVAFEAAIRDGLARALTNGLDADDFERSRRKHLGDYVRGLNSPEAIANQLTDIGFKGQDFFQIPDLIATLSLSDANAALRSHYRLEQTAVSIVWPNGDAVDNENEEEEPDAA